MRCAELGNLLSRLEPHPGEQYVADLGGGEHDLLADAVGRGWVARIEELPIDRGGLGPGRAALAELRARRERGESGPPLDIEERRLREELLALSEKLARYEGSVGVSTAEGGPYRGAATSNASPGRFALTVRGRALLADLAPRLARVGSVELEEFDEDMRILRATLSGRARRAAEILKLVSPHLQQVDEVHLRSAAVGLAVRRERPEAVAQTFLRVLRGGLLHSALPDDKESVAAECMIVRSRALNEIDVAGATGSLLNTYNQLQSAGIASMTDAANASLLVAAALPVDQARVLDAARTLLTLMPPLAAAVRELAPALHLVVTGYATDPNLPTRLAEIEAAVRTLTGDDPQSFAAAAILVGARTNLAALLARFGPLLQVLGRFSRTGLVVPAALLALLDAGEDEILDNVRLAGAAISEHRLALGGMENMSLAVKLLLEVSILATGTEGDPEEQLDLARCAVPSLPAMGPAGLAVALPMMVAAVSTFHQTTIHRMAVSDFAFHPAHSHYVYG